ncbi:MAG TPA: peptidylprolyl isomerase [bacterium]|nr:peptidylprolyl isomerase [bacterium]HQJ65275.1 peptidylprolyl isomerase [bacterium]
MRWFQISLNLLILVVLLALTGCSDFSKKSPEVVARIGQQDAFTFENLQQYVSDWSYMRKFKSRSEAYSVALEDMITNQLKRIDFFARGLDQDEKWIQSIRRIINEELVAEYYTERYEKKYANAEQARRVYDVVNRVVYYRQILLQLPERAPQETIQSLRQKALDIKSEIERGGDFDQLLATAANNSAKNSDRAIRPVGWEQTVYSSLDSAIFNLPRGALRVLFNPDGFHIVQIVNVEDKTPEPFEKIKDELVAKLRNAYADKSLNEFENEKSKTIDDASLIWNETALRQLVKWAEDPRFYIDRYKDILQKAVVKNNAVLLTCSAGRIDLREYLRLLNTVLIPRSSKKLTVEDHKRFILEALRTDQIVKRAEQLGLRKKIFHARTVNPVLKNQIAVLYNQAVIDSQIPKPTEEMLRNFYNQQKDSLYYQLKKINIFAMIYNNEQTAKETMQKIADGTPFEKVSERWLVKTFIRNRDGSIKSYLSVEKPYLGEAAFRTNLNETAGPIAYHDPEAGDQYAVIKNVYTQPEKQLSYDDVKNTIAEDFRKYMKDKMTRQVRNRLWQQYDAKTFPKVLDRNLKTNK